MLRPPARQPREPTGPPPPEALARKPKAPVQAFTGSAGGGDGWLRPRAEAKPAPDAEDSEEDRRVSPERPQVLPLLKQTSKATPSKARPKHPLDAPPLLQRHRSGESGEGGAYELDEDMEDGEASAPWRSRGPAPPSRPPPIGLSPTESSSSVGRPWPKAPKPPPMPPPGGLRPSGAPQPPGGPPPARAMQRQGSATSDDGPQGRVRTTSWAEQESQEDWVEEEQWEEEGGDVAGDEDWREEDEVEGQDDRSWRNQSDRGQAPWKDQDSWKDQERGGGKWSKEDWEDWEATKSKDKSGDWKEDKSFDWDLKPVRKIQPWIKVQEEEGSADGEEGEDSRRGSKGKGKGKSKDRGKSKDGKGNGKGNDGDKKVRITFVRGHPSEEEPPDKFGDTWEELRKSTGLQLLGELAPRNHSWDYVVNDESRRCFAGFLKNPFSRQMVDKWEVDVREGTDWKQPMGKHGPVPRQTAWMVKRGCECTYRYGGVEVEPEIFPPWMMELLKNAMPMCGLPDPKDWPDSCNMNLYEDGGMSVGWHSDDERLFQGSFRDIRIISLSFGQKRRFDLRLNWPEDEAESSTRMKHVTLGTGDLMTMEGMVQKHFQHRVPREENVSGARINLTWRWIVKHTPKCPCGRHRQ